MSRLNAWLAAAWQFLREVSGEAALERKLRAHDGCVTDALADAGDRPRCC